MVEAPQIQSDYDDGADRAASFDRRICDRNGRFPANPADQIPTHRDVAGGQRALEVFAIPEADRPWRGHRTAYHLAGRRRHRYVHVSGRSAQELCQQRTARGRVERPHGGELRQDESQLARALEHIVLFGGRDPGDPERLFLGHGHGGAPMLQVGIQRQRERGKHRHEDQDQEPGSEARESLHAGL